MASVKQIAVGNKEPLVGQKERTFTRIPDILGP